MANALRPFLKANQWRVVKIAPYGDCLFEAAVTAAALENGKQPEDVHGDGMLIRQLAVNHLLNHRNEYVHAMSYDPKTLRTFNTSEINKAGKYCRSMRQKGVYGGELELRALAEYLRRRIAVYEPVHGGYLLLHEHMIARPVIGSALYDQPLRLVLSAYRSGQNGRIESGHYEVLVPATAPKTPSPVLTHNRRAANNAGRRSNASPAKTRRLPSRSQSPASPPRKQSPNRKPNASPSRSPSPNYAAIVNMVERYRAKNAPPPRRDRSKSRFFNYKAAAAQMKQNRR